MNLKEIRIKKGISQKKLAEVLGVTQTQMYRIEKGISTLNSEQIIKLCKFLNVSADELLGLKPINENILENNETITEEQIKEVKKTLENISNYLESLLNRG